MTHAAAHAAPLRAALLLIAAAASLFGTTSCGASRTLHPRSAVIQADNERVLWNALRLTIVKEEFMVSGVGADPVARTIKSGWKVDEVPFGRMRGSENYRARVIAQYGPYDPEGKRLPKDLDVPDRLDPDLESFVVTLRIEKEHNKSLRPGIPRYAKWKPADDDPAWAKRMMLQLRSRLGTTEFRLTDEKKSGPPYDLDIE